MICEQYKTNDVLEQTNEKLDCLRKEQQATNAHLDQLLIELRILNKSIAEIGWVVMHQHGRRGSDENVFWRDWREEHKRNYNR